MLYFRRIKLIYILMPMCLMFIFSCDNNAKDETSQIVQEVVTMKVPPIENSSEQQIKTKSEDNNQTELKFKNEYNLSQTDGTYTSQSPNLNENNTNIDNKIVYNPIAKNNVSIDMQKNGNQDKNISKIPSSEQFMPLSSSTTPLLTQNSNSSKSTTGQPLTDIKTDSNTTPTKIITSDQSNTNSGNPGDIDLLKSQEFSNTINEEKLFYVAKGKKDPFEPLIKDKPPVEEIKETFEEDIPERILTPLEKLDFGQMKLVAILTRESGSVAMVQEATGKGYIVNIGTYMGRNSGQVISIEKDKLVIQEKVKDYKGNLVDRFQELKLNKLDDKG